MSDRRAELRGRRGSGGVSLSGRHGRARRGVRSEHRVHQRDVRGRRDLPPGGRWAGLRVPGRLRRSLLRDVRGGVLAQRARRVRLESLPSESVRRARARLLLGGRRSRRLWVQPGLSRRDGRVRPGRDVLPDDLWRPWRMPGLRRRPLVRVRSRVRRPLLWELRRRGRLPRRRHGWMHDRSLPPRPVHGAAADPMRGRR